MHVIDVTSFEKEEILTLKLERLDSGIRVGALSPQAPPFDVSEGLEGPLF